MNPSQVNIEASWQKVLAEEFRKNIYETIKQEIRSGLRKEF